jgi:peptide/nickel transport system permease protein
VAIGVILGVPLGIFSALRQYSWLDSVILVLSMIFAACPGFVLALLLISEFSVKLGWFPAVGLPNALGYVLPMVTIALGSLSRYTRITRSSFLEVIRQDYIRTARAKGQNERNIIWKHAFRNAAIPIASSIGVQIGNQLGGALIVETVFGIPGVGKYIGDAITSRNFPAIQGGVLFLAFVFTVVNLLVDISFIYINPRLKSGILSGGKHA